ncbi:Two-component system response regulator [gamma proteobacterium IMCC1989]|nr:Two-component system response regulator [gamma proteobacterium IMCC1989]
MTQAIEILMVEDNPADVELTKEAFNEGKLNNVLNVVSDGEEALNYLHKRGRFTDAKTPDIVLLDLNLPKVNGKEVLAEMKGNKDLSYIPVIILSSSEDTADIKTAYELNANSFVTKPVAIDDFLEVIKSIEHFWVEIVKLPNNVA